MPDLHDVVSAAAGPMLGWALRASAEAAAIAAVVWVAQRALGRWLTPAWRHRLWGLVVLRLVLPVPPASPTSVWNAVPALAALPGTSILFGPSAGPGGDGETAAGGSRSDSRSSDSEAPALPRPGQSTAAPDAATTGNGQGLTVRVGYGPLDPAVGRPAEANGVAADARRAAAAAGPNGGNGRLVGGSGEGTTSGLPESSVPAPSPSTAGPSATAVAAAAVVWLSGVILLLVRLIRSNAAFSRRLRSAAVVTDPAVLALLADCAAAVGLRRAPPVLETDAVTGPAAAGVLRPRLLVPPGLLATLSPAERRAVLLHELAHVRRRDVAANWALAVLSAVHWFNPAVWLAFARLRADRELARDAMVLAAAAAGRTDRPDDDEAEAVPASFADQYARTLLKLAHRAASAAVEPAAGRRLLAAATSPGFVGMVADDADRRTGDATQPSRPPAFGEGILPGLLGRRSGLERRLTMITETRSAITKRLALVGPALFLAIGGGTLTGPRATAATNPTANVPTTVPAEAAADMVARTRQLTRDGRFADALVEVDKILAADPQNAYALGVRPLLEVRVGSVPQRRYVDGLVAEKLERRIPEVHLDRVPFDDAIDYVRDVTGAAVFVNWTAVEAAGINRSAPMTVRLYDSKGSRLLDILLRSASKPDVDLGYTLVNDVVSISTSADLAKNRSASRPTSMPASRPAAAGAGFEDLALGHHLDRKLPEVVFNNVGFIDVLDFFREVGPWTDVSVDWRAVEAAGIEKTTPVSLRIYNVKADVALTTVLGKVAKPWAPLDWKVREDGVLLVSTASELAKDGPWSVSRPATRADGPEVGPRTDRRLPDVNFDGVSFGAALDFLRDVGPWKVVYINWRTIETVGVSKATLVNLRLHDVTAADALTTLLAKAGKPSVPLGWKVTDGVLAISTEAELKQRGLPQLPPSVPPTPPATRPNPDVLKRKVQERLDCVLPLVQLDQMGLADAIEVLREASGLNVFVNWRALEAAGVDRGKRVAMRLSNIRVGKALAVILDAASTPRAKLWYTIDEDVVSISSGPEDLSRSVVTRVYDVRDLVALVPDFDPDEGGTPRPGVGVAGQAATLPPAAEAASRPGYGLPEADRRAAAQADAIRQLRALIVEAVAPDSWREAGGTAGQIKELSGQFIVTQTPENHQAIATLLDQMRQTRGVQVSVEGRFLSCADGEVDALLARWQKEGTAPATAPVAPAAPATGPANADGPATRPADAATGVFLSPAQVDELLRLAQASRSSAVVTAPRMTLFNGQRAYVLVSTQHAYVRDFSTVVVADGAIRYEPIIDSAESGVMMDAQATASADRRYVTLRLRPRLSALRELRDIPWSRRPAGSALTVQEPVLKVSELRTLVSVPNGGAVLLGGLEDPGPDLRPTAPTGVASKLADTRPAPGARADTDVSSDAAIRPAGADPADGAAASAARGGRRMYLLVRPTLILPPPPGEAGKVPMLKTQR